LAGGFEEGGFDWSEVERSSEHLDYRRRLRWPSGV